MLDEKNPLRGEMMTSPDQESNPPSEREKFDFDKRIREEDLALKVSESKRSRWSNPLIVAVLGAVLVGIGNIAGALYTAANQRSLAAINYVQMAAVENMRAENTNVLEVIKLSDSQKVRDGLCRLMKLNSIKSPDTSHNIQEYLGEAHCDKTLAIASDHVPPSTPTGDWKHVEAVVPGCGESGCYKSQQVCGAAPAKTKLTGATRNFVDSFAGAWGNWGDPPAIAGSEICRFFIQHSHNVARTVAFDYEVVPTE